MMLVKRVFSKNFWLTIKDVEQLLGWHRSKVRRWMKNGSLPFVRDTNGYARFPRREIEQLAQEDVGRIVHGPPGKVTAKAFALFAQGKTWQEVTIELGRDPHEAQPVEVVRKLHEQYRDQDKRPSSGSMEHGVKRPSQPEIDAADDELPPIPDADAWRREQEKKAREAQAALERDEQEWKEEQRKRAEQSARHIPRLPTPLAKTTPPEETAPVSERLALMLQLLAGRKPT